MAIEPDSRNVSANLLASNRQSNTMRRTGSGVRELMRNGCLCPRVTKADICTADFDRPHLRSGKFVADEMDDVRDNDRLPVATCGQIVAYPHDRQSVLVFPARVQYERHVATGTKQSKVMIAQSIVDARPGWQQGLPTLFP